MAGRVQIPKVRVKNFAVAGLSVGKCTEQKDFLPRLGVTGQEFGFVLEVHGEDYIRPGYQFRG